MSWFSFKGKRSDESDVFCILEKIPLDIRAEKITQVIEMPTGEPIIYEPGGYKTQVITINVGLKDITMAHIRNINNWLTGSGRLTFSNEPDKHYMAVCNNALAGNRMVEQLGKMPVQFVLMPFQRDNDDTFHEIELHRNGYGSWDGNTAGDSTHPYGTATSMPTLKVYGSGDLHMTHHATNTDIDVTGVDTFCIIDLPACKVYDKNNNVILDHVSGNIDEIITPANNAGTMTFSAWVTKVECKFNRRWL